VKETFMLCPECTYEEWVSPEDQAASFSQLLSHIRWTHPNADQNPDRLWPRITDVTR
jgi:hypothetical protein